MLTYFDFLKYSRKVSFMYKKFTKNTFCIVLRMILY